MKTTLLFSSLLLIVAIVVGCSDDVIKPDPCAGVVATSADFTMKEMYEDFAEPIETDTSLSWNPVEFSAKYEADEYEWSVGDDDRTWRTKSFRLNFIGFEGNVNVRLIARRNTINKQCTPDDDGIDTVAKVLTITNEPSILGSYRGANIENPTDSFTVTVRRTNYRGQDWFEIINMNKGCYDTTSGSVMYVNIGHKALRFTGFQSGHSNGTNRETACWDPKGMAQLNPDSDHILITYSVIDQSQEPKNRKIRRDFTFKGERI